MPQTFTAAKPPPRGTDTFTLAVTEYDTGDERTATFTYKTGRSYGAIVGTTSGGDLAFFRDALTDQAEYDRFVAFVTDQGVYVDADTIRDLARHIAEGSTAPHPTGPSTGSGPTTAPARRGSKAGARH